jgi:hypothetical protein
VDAEPVHNGRRLEITWEQVDEAVGAFQMLHGRFFPRVARSDATNIDTTYTWSWSVVPSAPNRMTDELLEAEHMEDDDSDDIRLMMLKLMIMLELHLLLLMRVMVKHCGC